MLFQTHSFQHQHTFGFDCSPVTARLFVLGASATLNLQGQGYNLEKNGNGSLIVSESGSLTIRGGSFHTVGDVFIGDQGGSGELRIP